jgi:hypothetical protein
MVLAVMIPAEIMAVIAVMVEVVMGAEVISL